MRKSTSASGDAAVLAPSSGDEPASPRHRASAASLERAVKFDLHTGIGVANGTACFAGGRRTGHIHRYTDEGRCGRGMVATPVWDVADLLKRYFFQKSLRAVVAKVDVEGMEYALFRRILDEGVDCAVTHYAVEWHGPNNPKNRPQMRAWEKLHRPNNESACALSHRFDDESYGCDPWPLPSNGAGDDSDWAVKSVKKDGRFWLGDGGC